MPWKSAVAVVMVLSLGLLESVSTQAQQATQFTCPEEFGYFPKPGDCTKYYVCVFGGALLESCTGGLEYSHELQTCDWPRNVDCSGNLTSATGGGAQASAGAVQLDNGISEGQTRLGRRSYAGSVPDYRQELRDQRIKDNGGIVYGRRRVKRGAGAGGPAPSNNGKHNDNDNETEFDSDEYYDDDDDDDDEYEDESLEPRPSDIDNHITDKLTWSIQSPTAASNQQSYEPPVEYYNTRYGASPNITQYEWAEEVPEEISSYGSRGSTSYNGGRGASISALDQSSNYRAVAEQHPQTSHRGATYKQTAAAAAAQQPSNPPPPPVSPLRTAIPVASPTYKSYLSTTDPANEYYNRAAFPTTATTTQATFYAKLQQPTSSYHVGTAAPANLGPAYEQQYTTAEEAPSKQYYEKSYDNDYYVYDDDLEAYDVDYQPAAAIQNTPSSTTTTTTKKPRNNGKRPTLKPSNNLLKNHIAAKPRDVYIDLPSRPQPVYTSPEPNSPAKKCKRENCLLPDCNCGGKIIPGGLQPSQVPQIVMLTFDDSVNDLNKGLYSDLFKKGRKNPNGCDISATFYVSHEWTDYGQVQSLAADGHEIASHSVTHSFGEKFSQKKWDKEVTGQREILAAYGGLKLSEIRGMRAPFLAIGGNSMFKMLYDSNWTYDSSMPVYENNPPSYPYTLDYKIFHDCMIPPCPTKSYPGVWEVPMVMWQDLKGGRCSMADACSNPPDAEGVYQMLAKNFERHYNSNRAPFGMYYHAAWFTQKHHKEGFEQFLDTLTQMEDVWLVTSWQALQWVRNPTPLNQILSFEPWQCDKQDRPPPCKSPRVCNLWHKSGVRYLKTCQACPEKYPWAGETGVPSPI